MTRLLPYLLLPLGVALLEYHGIQFWTVAVTGGWPGWFTVGFVAAWHAWGWPLLLEGGALWCWLQSRGNGWRAAGWTLGGGVLTIVLCAAALWNVAAPVRQNQAVTAALEEERGRMDMREDANKRIAAQAVSPSGVPYSRPLDQLYRTQARSVELFNEHMALAREGKLTTERQAGVLWWLQIACVLLGQGLVVAAARSVGNVGQPSTENHDGNQIQDGRRGAPEVGWTADDSGRRRFNSHLSILWDRWGVPFTKFRRSATGEAHVQRRPGGADDRGHAAGRSLQATDTAAPAELTHGPISSRPEGVADAAHPGAGSGQAGGADRTAGAVRESGGNAGVEFPESGGAHDLPTAGETPERPQENGESAEAEPGPPPGEPEGTTRAKAAWARIVTLWPMEADQARAAFLGISPRDLSLLRNHERWAEEKKTWPKTKVISENKLAVVEQALERFIQPGGYVPYNPKAGLPQVGRQPGAQPTARAKLQPMEPV